MFGLVEGRARAKAQAAELKRLTEERDHARAERDAAENVERRIRVEAQARRVVVWSTERRLDGGHPDRPKATADIVVQNCSDMPIFGIEANIEKQVMAGSPGRIVGGIKDVLLPDERHTWPVETDDPEWVEEYVVFRDAHGNIWRRRWDGELTGE
jgi:catechol 2,3-dioxygenase-like lactoylglutathione lyase family enzyme